jgi:hypothetical protein
MTPKHLRVRYRHQAAKPFYLNNDEVRSVAAAVRRQLPAAADGYRLTGETLLQIETIEINSACLDVCWSTGYPVSDARGDPVLGVCEYDHRGMPDTALISVNSELTRGKGGLLLGTLAHELAHAIFDVPGWQVMACQSGMPGSRDEAIHRVFRAVTVTAGSLAPFVGKAGDRAFGEWRANEFMGALLVPRDLLAVRLRHHAARIGIPCAAEHGRIALPQEGPPIAAPGEPAGASGRFGVKTAILLSKLAADFGVSPRFIQIRLLRYGLATTPQAAPGRPGAL